MFPLATPSKTAEGLGTVGCPKVVPRHLAQHLHPPHQARLHVHWEP